MSEGRRAAERGVRIVNTRLDRVGRATGSELHRRLIQATPVDTGRARGNWNASVDREDPRTDDDRRAPDAIRAAAPVIAGLSLSKGERLLLTNGLPYIESLNNGTSKQAPAAFIQQTTRAMEPFVDRLAQREGLRRG